MSDFANQQPLFRTTDPVTSSLAAEKLTRGGKRDSQKQQVLDYLRQHPGRWTSAEIAKYGHMERHMAARRLPDLEEDKLVQRCGTKYACSITGHAAVIWRLL